MARPIRSIIREFLEKVIKDEDEIHLQDVIRYARERFAKDEEFLEALLDDALGLLIADGLRGVMKHNRKIDIVPLEGGGGVHRERVEVRAKQLAARIFESVSDGHRKSLLAMTRSDLDATVVRRDAMIFGLSRYNAFTRDLRRGLRTEEQTVGERYSDTEFERIWQKHFDRTPDRNQLLLPPERALPRSASS